MRSLTLAAGIAVAMFQVAYTQNVRIDSAGRVGIGVNAPAHLLDVGGKIQAESAILLDGAKEGYYLQSDNAGNASWAPIIDPLELPRQPLLSVTDTLVLGGSPKGIVVEGDYAYIIDFLGLSLRVVDIRNPYEAVEVGDVAVGVPLDIRVDGNYVYVTNSTELHVVDVSDPTTPFIAGTVLIGSEPRYLDVLGSYAYIIRRTPAGLMDSELHVIDVSNPALPSSVATLGLMDDAQQIAAHGGFIYLLNGTSHHVKVVDISNPVVPFAVDSLPIPAFPWDIDVSLGFAYVMSSGIRIVDVSNALSMTETGFSNGAFFHGRADGEFMFVTNGAGGEMKIFDISNSAFPSFSASIELGPMPGALAVQGNFAYVIDEADDDLRIISWVSPGILGIETDGKLTAITQSWKIEAGNVTLRDPGARVGLGISEPVQRLEVAGKLRVLDGSQQDGFILTSDSEGVSTWTDPADIFIDTDTDDQVLFFVEGIAALGISDGNIVSLLSLKDNTDAQTLTWDTSNTLAISGGNSVDIGSLSDDLGNHSATQNLALNDYWLSGDGNNEGVYVDTTGRVGIGTSSPGEELEVNGNLFVDGDITHSGSVTMASDMRFKDRIEPITGVMDRINGLNGYYYRWRTEEYPGRNFNDQRQIGVMAQEVESVFPELVRTDANGYKSVDYARLSAILIEAVKELSAENEQLSEDVRKIRVHLGLE